MAKAPAFQFYIKDWLSDPQLKMTSFSTKGIWIDMLCYMWGAPEKGTLSGTKEELSRMVGTNGTEFDRFLDEAKRLLFCDICVTDNEIITLCNRRMFRDEKDRKNNRLRQQKFRGKQKSNEEIMPLSPTASPKEEIYKEKKSIYGEFKNVMLTDDEYGKLKSKFGDAGTKQRIENISSYVASKGKKYSSHYATILTWERKNTDKDTSKCKTPEWL